MVWGVWTISSFLFSESWEEHYCYYSYSLSFIDDYIYFIRGDMWSGEFELFHHFYLQSPEKSTAVNTAIKNNYHFYSYSLSFIDDYIFYQRRHVVWGVWTISSFLFSESWEEHSSEDSYNNYCYYSYSLSFIDDYIFYQKICYTSKTVSMECLFLTFPYEWNYVHPPKGRVTYCFLV